jgi:hypothetical protein
MIKETPYTRSRLSFTPRNNMPTPTPTKTKPAKPKHMDSQLDFIAVEDTRSFATQDSQLMTEHQKEVREEQARTAEMFPELMVGVNRKPKKTMKLGSESPSAKRRTSVGASWTPEPAGEGGAKMPDPPVSFVAESQMDPHPSLPTSPAPRAVSTTRKGAWWDSKGESSEPADSTDVPMADCDNDSRNGQSKDAILPSDDDEPSADNFVDAPDRFSTSENSLPVDGKSVPDDDGSPLKDIPDIAIAIPPVKNSEDYAQDFPPAPHGPDAQIIAEVLSASGTPSTTRNNGKRSRKRKRGTPAKQDAAESPEMLDTIVIAADTNRQSSPQRKESVELERPAKRARGKEVNVTPLRISARKNKGVKATPRDASSALVSKGNDPDGSNGKSCYSIIEIEMHTKNGSKENGLPLRHPPGLVPSPRQGEQRCLKRRHRRSARRMQTNRSLVKLSTPPSQTPRRRHHLRPALAPHPRKARRLKDGSLMTSTRMSFSLGARSTACLKWITRRTPVRQDEAKDVHQRLWRLRRALPPPKRTTVFRNQ